MSIKKSQDYWIPLLTLDTKLILVLVEPGEGLAWRFAQLDKKPPKSRRDVSMRLNKTNVVRLRIVPDLVGAQRRWPTQTEIRLDYTPRVHRLCVWYNTVIMGSPLRLGLLKPG